MRPERSNHSDGEPTARANPVGVRAGRHSGKADEARREYQDFLALWKDADPDLRLLQQAKSEYARLAVR